MKAPETKRLKLKCEEPLSNFAFKFNLRRYTLVAVEAVDLLAALLEGSRLNQAWGFIATKHSADIETTNRIPASP
jgi:hypothetical protein